MENAKQHTSNVKARAIASLLKEKAMTLEQIANRLNDLGFETRRRSKYKPETVRRLLNANQQL